MSESEPPAPIPLAKPISGVEIVCVALLPILCGYLILTILTSMNFFPWFYGEAPGKPLSRMELRQSLWVGAIAAPFYFLLALLLLRLGIGMPIPGTGLTTRNLGRNILGGLLFAVIFVPGTYGILTLALMVLEAVGSKPKDHPFTQLGSSGLSPIEWALLIFGAVVVAPVWEEFVYRGLIQPWVMRRGRTGGLIVLAITAALALYSITEAWSPSPSIRELVIVLAPVWILLPLVGVYHFLDRRNTEWGGLFATALLFAWVHVNVWPSPVPLLWLALGLGWLAWRGRSLAGAIVLHAVFNAIACAALLYGGKDSDVEKTPIPPAHIVPDRKDLTPPALSPSRRGSG